MRIATDAIVQEHLLLILVALKEIAMKVQEERDQEIMVMGILECMLSVGIIEHEFDPEENIDIFTNTPRLIRNWEKICPGHTLKASADDDHVIYELSGTRSYFFNKKWLSKRLRKDGKRAWELVVNPGRKSNGRAVQ